MKYLRLFIVITVIILGGSLSDISAQTYVNGKNPDSAIERKVFKKLLGLPYYGVFDTIAFRIEGETVVLSGRVARSRNKRDAQDAVERVKGVKQVVNNIRILPLSPFDDAIRIRLLRTFAGRGGLFRYLQEPNPSVRLIVEGGRVSLEGYVANRGDYNLMNILANGVPDVFAVTNNLVIEKEQVR